jgi:hypothetical protein
VAVCFQQAAPLAHTTSPMTAPCAGIRQCSIAAVKQCKNIPVDRLFKQALNGASLCAQLQHFYACLIDQSDVDIPCLTVFSNATAVHRSQFDSVASLVWVLGSSTTISGAVPATCQL